jgi:hypothetical protein
MKTKLLSALALGALALASLDASAAPQKGGKKPAKAQALRWRGKLVDVRAKKETPLDIKDAATTFAVPVPGATKVSCSLGEAKTEDRGSDVLVERVLECGPKDYFGGWPTGKRVSCNRDKGTGGVGEANVDLSIYAPDSSEELFKVTIQCGP